MTYSEMFETSDGKYKSCTTVGSPEITHSLKSFGSMKFDLHFSFVSSEARETTRTSARYTIVYTVYWQDQTGQKYFDDEEYTVETC